MDSETVSVIGLGYVGLTLSVVAARAGYKIYGVETDESVLRRLCNGEPHFFEKGLKELLQRRLHKKIFLSKDVPEAGVYIICVGTPVDERKNLVTRHIETATKSVAERLKKGALVILRSTVPIGVSRKIVLPLLEKISSLRPGKDFYFAFAPERTVEGRALHELKTLPQIIGGYDTVSSKKTQEFFKAFVAETIILDDMEHAEMLKMLDNTYRDVLFAYTHQMALIAERLSLDYHKIVSAANCKYPRNNVPFAGPGVGGPCLTKDPYILIELCKELGVTNGLISAARLINEYIPKRIAEKIIEKLKSLGKNADSCKIFIMGFAFKGNPETSDMRASNTLDLLNALKPTRARICGFDRQISDGEIEKLDVTPCSIEEGFKNADVIVSMHDHSFYRELPIKKLLQRANRPCVVVDVWRLWDEAELKSIKGVCYTSIGLC